MALETLRRYREFCDSAAPASLSYYTNGAWTRFPNASLALARLAFAERRSAFMLNDAENVPFLVDVLRMAVVNSRTGEPRPLSWRDVNGRRYVHHAAAAAGDRADAANAEGEGENDGPDDDDNGIVICERDDEEAAKEDAEMKAKERLRMFGERFVERMGLGVSGCVVVRVKRLRPTPQHLQEYDLHFVVARTSFADARKINACLPVNNSQPSGPVRLFPAHFPISGATYASVNKSGEQEMMFGKLILGDIVEGSSDSEQLSLENGQYLTVADNASNPTCYFLRRESIRARFMPEYVVIFKISPLETEYWAKAQEIARTVSPHDNAPNDKLDREPTGEMEKKPKDSTEDVQKTTVNPKKRPRSAWMSFPLLLSEVERFLTTAETARLRELYAKYKDRKLSREDLIKRMRLLTGDRVLTLVIKTFYKGKVHRKMNRTPIQDTCNHEMVCRRYIEDCFFIFHITCLLELYNARFFGHSQGALFHVYIGISLV